MTVSLRPMTSARLPSRRCRGRTVPGAAWVVAEGAGAMREKGLAFSLRLQMREIVKAKEKAFGGEMRICSGFVWYHDVCQTAAGAQKKKRRELVSATL